MIVSFSMMFGMIQSPVVYARDFSGEEAYYEDYCSVPRETAEEAQTCVEFKTYMRNKANNAKQEVDALAQELASVQENVDALEAHIEKYDNLIQDLDDTIQEYQVTIDKINESLIVLEENIQQTEADIEKRDQLIKKRMQTEQPGIGINAYIEIVMGSKDILDLIRNATGLQAITENDQEEIAKLEEDKRKLSLQKQEQDRLKVSAEEKQNEIVKQKELQEEAKQQQEALLTTYRAQEAELIQKKRDAQSAADAVQSAIININTSVAGSIPNVKPSGGWMRPVSAGYSAHTFYYPWGTFHAGADFASNVHSPIVAPISGIIVYSSNPVGTNDGSMANWKGYPAGAGNSIHMIGQVNGTTYGLSFFHMAKENWISYPGQAVTQGQVIGYTGASGHVDGAHLHFEIINLGTMSMADAIARFQSTRKFDWGTGWYSESTTCNVKGSTPCREQPEKFLGW